MALIPLDLYLAFVAASLALIAMPGPNTSLIVGNTLAYGTRPGLVTLAGTSTGLVIQMTVIGFGLAETMNFFADLFDKLRWVGVAYLVWLGLRQWFGRDKAEADRTSDAAARHRRFYFQGFGVCMTNPKTLAFFAAFLPQFVLPSRPAGPQLVSLGVTFIALGVMGDTIFCLTASHIRPWVAGAKYARIRRGVLGTCLLACGLGLALARRS